VVLLRRRFFLSMGDLDDFMERVRFKTR
jgi:hypothetical protein